MDFQFIVQLIIKVTVNVPEKSFKKPGIMSEFCLSATIQFNEGSSREDQQCSKQKQDMKSRSEEEASTQFYSQMEIFIPTHINVHSRKPNMHTPSVPHTHSCTRFYYINQVTLREPNTLHHLLFQLESCLYRCGGKKICFLFHLSRQKLWTKSSMVCVHVHLYQLCPGFTIPLGV